MQADLYDYLAKNPGSATFVSLSDTPSYAESRQSTIDRSRQDAVANLTRHLADGLAAGGIAVARYFRFRPDMTQLEDLVNVTSDYMREIGRERTCIYSIDVFQKTA